MYRSVVKLLIASSNAGKILEVQEGLSGLPLTILTPNSLLSPLTFPEETGTTYAENAAIKAHSAFDQAGMPILADDSGIIVEALKAELGLHTRRWGAGPEVSDQEWIAHFLARMKLESDKRACFLCHLAYIDQGGALHTFEGRCEGMITETLEAPYLPGLPISACFKPHSFDRVFSALSIEQKNYTSHRGRALQKFKIFLEKSIENPQATSACGSPEICSKSS